MLNGRAERRRFGARPAALLVGGNIQGHTRVLTTAIVLETGKGEFALALTLGAWLLTLAFLASLVMLRLQGRPVP